MKHLLSPHTQRTAQTLALGLFVSMLLALSVACSSLGAPSLQGQTDEVRKLNTALSAQWTQFDSTIESTQMAVQQLPQLGSMNPQKVDMNLLRKAMVGCFETPVQEPETPKADAEPEPTTATPSSIMAKAETVAKHKNECETEEITAYKKKSQPEISGFVDSKLASVALIKTSIKATLPTLSKDITASYPVTKARALALRTGVDEISNRVGSLGLPEAVMQTFNNELKEFRAELTTLEETLARVEAGSKDIPARISTTTERATYNLTSFGQ